jgi:hypothetical protein
MTRFVTVFLARSLPRILALALILTAVSAIAMLFAWMGPSMQRAELAVWERLPADLRIDRSATPAPKCLAVYDGVALQKSGAGMGPIAHPDLIVAGDVEPLLGMELDPQYPMAVDSIAATAAGLVYGDAVQISNGPLVIRGTVSTLGQAAKLNRAADGLIVVASGAMPSGAPPADEYLCLGAQQGTTVAALRASISQRQAAEGLTSATMLFAALAVLAWCVVVMLAVSGALRRGRQLRALLTGLGLRNATAAILSSAEVPVGGAIGIAAGISATWWSRSEVLRMWTEPTIAALTGGIFAAALGVIWLGSCVLPRSSET